MLEVYVKVYNVETRILMGKDNSTACAFVKLTLI